MAYVTIIFNSTSSHTWSLRHSVVVAFFVCVYICMNNIKRHIVCAPFHNNNNDDGIKAVNISSCIWNWVEELNAHTKWRECEAGMWALVGRNNRQILFNKIYIFSYLDSSLNYEKNQLLFLYVDSTSTIILELVLTFS